MYTPKYFEVTDKAEIFAFIEENAFGQLISNTDGRLFATHIPFLLSEDKRKIVGHLAAQNPQHSDIEDQEVLITFQGAHDYISPSWHTAPGVPTWNYQAVHIYGRGKVLRSPEDLRAIVDGLTHKYESGNPQPWNPEYNASMLNAIVGVEITIEEIQCTYRLGQNRPAQERMQVAAQLKKNGSHVLASSIMRTVL